MVLPAVPKISTVHSMVHSTIPVHIPVQQLEMPIILTTSNHFVGYGHHVPWDGGRQSGHRGLQ